MTKLKYFSADWCTPCQQQKPVIESIEARDGVTVERYDVEDDTGVANEYNVMSVPTIVVESGGTPVEQFTGFTAEAEILDVIDE
jgi:thioredoxin 1